jgi:hypothetical protein
MVMTRTTAAIAHQRYDEASDDGKTKTRSPARGRGYREDNRVEKDTLLGS